MEHFVTLFDSLFLPQGLALHLSMERHIKLYTLWIVCVDDKVYDVLLKINLPHVRLLKLSDIETEALKKVKPDRSKGEYCWTLTPFAPLFVFEAEATVARVTYIDADMWFRKDPAPIFNEFSASGKSVLITDHAYDAEYDHTEKSGKYCVQWITFTRDKGETVRKWWEERCIEWCYARMEDGKFGDQKYLDDWPDRFADTVYVLGHKEYTLAPWNAKRFPYNDSIVYHFHAFRIMNAKKVQIHNNQFYVPTITLKHIYLPYLHDIKTAITTLISIGERVLPQKKLQLKDWIILYLWIKMKQVLERKLSVMYKL